MTRKKTDLPKRVYARHGRYYFVTLAGKWEPLTREDEGLPAVWRAYAALFEQERTADRMPAVVGRWLAEKEPDWAEKHAENQRRYGKVLGAAFADFAPGEVATRDCNEFLMRFRANPRTHNAYRTALRQILALAAREGLRDGANPVDNIPTRSTPGRMRAVSDAEIDKLRAQALSQPRNGKALAQMIDLALLTGMRIGDLIRMRWQDVGRDGITYLEGKKRKTPRLVEWSPALRAAIKACERGDRIGHVLQKEAGGGYRYAGIRSAWVRACDRAGIDDLNIHDFRGRAGVDAMGEDEDIKKAQRLLGHSGEAMTRHYVEGKYAKRTKPAK